MGLTLASLWAVGECLYLPGPQLPQLHKASESIFPVETVLGTDWVASGVLGSGSKGESHRFQMKLSWLPVLPPTLLSCVVLVNVVKQQ